MSTGTELSALFSVYMHNDAALTAANKLTYLNLGLKRILRDAPSTFRLKEATITTADGTQEYSLASDFYLMAAMWLQSTGRKLSPMLAGEFIDTVERMPTIPEGPPEEYIIMGYDESQDTPAWRVRFDKTCDAIYSVEYWYNPVPTAITADATPAISSMGFDELLLWAAVMIALQPKDPDGHQIARGNYLENLAEWKAYRTSRPDYVPVLRPASEEYATSTRFPLTPHYPG
jgi:hypothetical protein